MVWSQVLGSTCRHSNRVSSEMTWRWATTQFSGCFRYLSHPDCTGDEPADLKQDVDWQHEHHNIVKCLSTGFRRALRHRNKAALPQRDPDSVWLVLGWDHRREGREGAPTDRCCPPPRARLAAAVHRSRRKGLTRLQLTVKTNPTEVRVLLRLSFVGIQVQVKFIVNIWCCRRGTLCWHGTESVTFLWAV